MANCSTWNARVRPRCCSEGCDRYVQKAGNRCKFCAQQARRQREGTTAAPRAARRPRTRPPWPRLSPIVVDALRAELEARVALRAARAQERKP